MHIFMDRLLLFCSSVVRFLLNLFSFIRFKSSPHRPVHINALPEECLLAIFDQIPLSDLMLLDQVCHQWALLLPSATVRRLTLVLIIDGYGLDGMCFDIPFNDHFELSYDRYRPYFNLPVSERDAALTLPFLVPRSFDQFLFSNLDLNGFFDILYHTTHGGHTEANFTEMARFKHARLTGQLSTYFGDLFPNVNTLMMIHPECFEAELQAVVDLLGCWPLVNLKLWLHTVDIDERYEHLPDRHPVGNLLRSINHQQASLQQLTLSIEGVRKTDETIKFSFPVEHFSFVGQLKVAKLSLGFYDTDNSIWQTVHRLDSTKLRYIGLGNRADLYENDALNPQFAYTHKVRQLYSHRSFETEEELGEMCSRFNLLNMLEIYWLPNITFTELVAKLASLQQLTYLKFEIAFERHPVNAFALVDQVSGDQQEDQPRRLISLPQVKILKFLIKKRTHQDFESFSPNVFPSVESITVDNVRSPPVTECIICRPNANGPHNPEMANQCNRMLICSLKDKFATTNSSIRIYPQHATSVDTPLDAPIIQHPMMRNVSKGDVVVLLVNVVNMFIFHVYAFSKMADQLIYSNNTDQTLKQSLNDTKFYMMFNVLTNTLWVLARFGCMASYITWQKGNSQVVNGRKILNVLKSGSYATALLLSLVTGLASYYLINATFLMSSSDKVIFRFLLGLVYLLLMGLTILVELFMGRSFCSYKNR